MPKAKATSVATASQGNILSVSARKRDGLARSVSLIATPYRCVSYSCAKRSAMWRPQCGDPNAGRLGWSAFHDHVIPMAPLFQPLTQPDGGAQRTDHQARQRQRAQDAERRA